MSGKINIEAVYTFPEEQTLSKQSVPEWVTFAEAIKLGIKEVSRMRAEEGVSVIKDGGEI